MKALKKLTAFIGIVVGLGLMAGGVWGISFTYQSIAAENIVTPADASIPEAAVRGPMTLMSQIDIIRHHTFASTGDRTYAEMSRDEDRSIWITATTLNTALYQGVMAYGLSAIAIANGLFMFLVGLVFCGRLRHHKKK